MAEKTGIHFTTSFGRKSNSRFLIVVGFVMNATGTGTIYANTFIYSCYIVYAWVLIHRYAYVHMW